jgi:integrase
VPQALALIRSAERDFADLLTAGFLTGAPIRRACRTKCWRFRSCGEDADDCQWKDRRSHDYSPIRCRDFFLAYSGRPWRKGDPIETQRRRAVEQSHQQRRMAAILAASGLNKSGTFYALRHSYISRAIEGGVPLNIIAETCGTSVRMIENTYAKILAEKRRDCIERGAPSLS